MALPMSTKPNALSYLQEQEAKPRINLFDFTQQSTNKSNYFNRPVNTTGMSIQPKQNVYTPSFKPTQTTQTTRPTTQPTQKTGFSLIPTTNAGYEDQLTDEELQTLINEGYSDEEIIKLNNDLISGSFKPTTQEQPIFQDQYKNEGVTKQTVKAIPRALFGVAQGIVSGAETTGRGVNNVLSKTVGDYGLYPTLNAIGYALKGDAYQPISSEDTVLKENVVSNVIPALKEKTLGEKGFLETYKGANTADVEKYGNQNLFSDITDIPKGATQTAFNVLQTPASLGLNIAGEAPGTQYIMQGLGKAIEGLGEVSSEITGLDKNATQNIIETFMNRAGLKTKGGTIETAGKISEAYKTAPTKTSGVYQGGKILAKDVGTHTYNITKMPIDIVKGGLKATGIIKPTKSAEVKAYESYKKAVSPSVTDTNTPQKAQKHQENVITFGKDIVENKNNLVYRDTEGNIIGEGRLPKTINETAQATIQRTEEIYNNYRDLEKQTGLDTPISYEPVINNLNLLKEKIKTNPELQELIPYIDKKIEAYQKTPGSLDGAIQTKKTLNQKLKMFFSKGNYADIGKDAVDVITNKSIGEILDNSINNSKYGELKQKWGAIKNLQKEIFHRDTVTGRQKEYGFFDLANPLTAVELIEGLVTQNPLNLVKAGGIQGAKWYMKYRNSPNTQIQEFFKNIEKSNLSTNKGKNVNDNIVNNSVNNNIQSKPTNVKALPKGKIITPYNTEKAVIQESKKGLENTKFGNTEHTEAERLAFRNKRNKAETVEDIPDLEEYNKYYGKQGEQKYKIDIADRYYKGKEVVETGDMTKPNHIKGKENVLYDVVSVEGTGDKKVIKSVVGFKDLGDGKRRIDVILEDGPTEISKPTITKPTITKPTNKVIVKPKETPKAEPKIDFGKDIETNLIKIEGKKFNGKPIIINGEKVGGILHRIIPNENKTILLEKIEIFPEYRGKNYARKVIEKLFKDNPESKEISLSAVKSAEPIWEKLGFKYQNYITKEGKVYEISRDKIIKSPKTEHTTIKKPKEDVMQEKENLTPNPPKNVSNKTIKKPTETGGKTIKDKVGDFVDKVAEKVGAKINLLGGEGSMKSPVSNLEKAKNMESVGYSAEKIWEKTGWEKGTDGKWKFEIDDSDFKFTDKFKTSFKSSKELDEFREMLGHTKRPITEYINHPKLFEQYPEIKNIKLTYNDTFYDKSSYSPKTNTITIGNGGENEIKSNILHEIQHNIQEIEGFAKGGDTSLGFDRYKKLAGETEARNIQTRLLKTPAERKILRPAKTEDVARDKQIIKKDGGKAMSVSDDLITSAEEDLIYKYTQTGGGTSKPMGLQEQKKVNEVLSKLPDNKEQVYSGLKLTNDQYSDLLYSDGDIWTSKRLLSSSTERNVAKGFMDYNPKNLQRVFLTINGGGKDISGISGFNGIGGEKEVLFPIGQKFKVEKISYNDFELTPIYEQAQKSKLLKKAESKVSDDLVKGKINWNKQTNKKFTYKINCVDCDNGSKIGKMVDGPFDEKITYKDFIKVVPEEDIRKVLKIPKGINLDNYSNKFYRSVYEGEPAYYIQNSGIEWVWTNKSKIKIPPK